MEAYSWARSPYFGGQPQTAGTCPANAKFGLLIGVHRQNRLLPRSGKCGGVHVVRAGYEPILNPGRKRHSRARQSYFRQVATSAQVWNVHRAGLPTGQRCAHLSIVIGIDPQPDQLITRNPRNRCSQSPGMHIGLRGEGERLPLLFFEENVISIDWHSCAKREERIGNTIQIAENSYVRHIGGVV